MGKKILKAILKYPIILLNRITVYFYFKFNKKRGGEEELSFAKGEKILVLAPHVDDETIGLGGSLLKYSRKDTPLSLVYLTDGSGCSSHLTREETISLRKEEGYEVKNSYGFDEVHFLDKIDGSLNSQDPDLLDRLVRLLDRIKPDLVFTPFLVDGNTDHIETTKALYKALKKYNTSFENIYLYQVNTIIEPKLVNAIGLIDKEIFEGKVHKYNIFKSQWAMGFKIFHSLDRARALAYDNIKAAEAFVKLDFRTLEEIIIALERNDFDPQVFTQISSEFTLLPSLVKARRSKNTYNELLIEILEDKELGGSPI